MKELITRIEELAVQVAGAQLQIDKSEAESRELGRELGKARQKMMELVNERDHALARVPPESWAKENKRLAAQSEDLLGVIERRELLIKSLNDEITKRDHELRAHEKELAEQREEIRKIRAEVPLESTREGLKNAVAKLQEVTTDRDRLQNELAAIYAEANKSGYCNGDPVAQIKKGQHDADMVVSLSAQLQAATTRADNVATCRDRWMKIAADSGRMDGEDVGEFIARLAQQSAQGVELAVKVEELRVASIEREAALERLKDSDDRNTRTIANLSVELSARYAEIAELHKWATGLIENQSFARNAPERTMHYREIVERINGRPRLDLTATLPVIDWQAICIKREDEIARLNAKLGPLEALYKTLKGYHDSDKIIGHGSIIKVAIDVATEALSQLTA